MRTAAPVPIRSVLLPQRPNVDQVVIAGEVVRDGGHRLGSPARLLAQLLINWEWREQHCGTGIGQLVTCDGTGTDFSASGPTPPLWSRTALMDRLSGRCFHRRPDRHWRAAALSPASSIRTAT